MGQRFVTIFAPGIALQARECSLAALRRNAVFEEVANPLVDDFSDLEVGKHMLLIQPCVFQLILSTAPEDLEVLLDGAIDRFGQQRLNLAACLLQGADPSLREAR